MQSNRTPDRVHVVQRPQNDDGKSAPAPTPAARGSEIVRTLAQINDKLKRSEAERYELLAELREYRKAISSLEDKAEMSEKAYLSLEHKIQTRDGMESDITERQARFEKSLKATEEKLVKTVAGQAVLDQKLRENEDRHTALTVRLDESVSQQTRLNMQIEKVADDKSRMLRKVDRLEEVIQETQDALKARALVLLTDQSAAAQAALPSIPAWADVNAANDADMGEPWWRRSVKMQSVGMAAMVAAALLLGWSINQVQQPDVPQIALLEGGGVARLNLSENRWEQLAMPGTTPAEQTELTPQDAETPAQETDTAPVFDAQQPAQEEQAVEDQTLFDTMDTDPDSVAAQLNELEPGAPQAVEEEAAEPASAAQAEQVAPVASGLMPDFDEIAFNQRGEIARAVAAEKDSRILTERASPDKSLPGPVRAIENQAFAGVGSAQHDLAAIYTAGHAGVAQDFDKAAFWFREAADNGIGNARYNLGVLYHQGLGVERDLGRALYWYREAAKLDHAEAQYNLGIAHIEGIGTDYDPLLAAAYFERAANQGIMEAAYNLGLIYENGLLGEAQPNEALLWYKIAADAGSADAKQALNTLAKAMDLSEAEVGQMVAKMQEVNKATKGRIAGPIKASTAE